MIFVGVSFYETHSPLFRVFAPAVDGALTLFHFHLLTKRNHYLSTHSCLEVRTQALFQSPPTSQWACFFLKAAYTRHLLFSPPK